MVVSDSLVAVNVGKERFPNKLGTRNFENIIRRILQHKYVYKISVRYSAKDKIQINNSFEFTEYSVFSKIGGGQRVEKIGNKSDQTIHYRCTSKCL